MKNSTFWVILFLSITTLFNISCSKEDKENENSITPFLSEIRPKYFENLNFNSAEVVSKIPIFLEDFKRTYEKLEEEYNSGLFTSSQDLDKMRLSGMYYSFYLLALTGNYLDGNLNFDDINGGREIGLYSGASSNENGFLKKELEEMMLVADKSSLLATNVAGFNDLTYGFHVAVKQVQQRLHNNNYNTVETHGMAIDYVGTRLVNYNYLANWNVMMSMVTMTNYNDTLNTFRNPRMNELLFHVNARFVPGSLPDLGGKYSEILGPLYRFDMNLKKLDWIFQNNETLSESQLENLDDIIIILQTAIDFIETDRESILNSWLDKNTFYQRKEKLNEIKNYRENISNGTTINKPFLKPFINSKDFKKAYQCYSCHRSSGL